MGVLVHTWGSLRSSWCWTPLCRILCIHLHTHQMTSYCVILLGVWVAWKNISYSLHLNVYLFLCAEETWKENDKAIQRYLTDTHACKCSYTAYVLCELCQTELGVSWKLSALLSPSSMHTCLWSHDKTLGKSLWWFMRWWCCDVREWTHERKGKTKCEAS